MSRNIIDLKGRVFSYLTVKEFSGIKEVGVSKSKKAMWLCTCTCGNEVIVAGNNLQTGCIKSCGCYIDSIRASMNTTHGQAKTSEYRAWVNMLSRCRNYNRKDWHHYGGRGILVCERWNIFSNFFEDMGFRPSAKYSLDRINNNGNYEPRNCKWSTRTEQIHNRRSQGFRKQERINIASTALMTIASWTKNGDPSTTLAHLQQLAHNALENMNKLSIPI